MLRNEYDPVEVTPPGATLVDLLAEIGMTQAELAQRTDRPVKTINEIAQGKAAITPDTSIQFERVLGTPASFWNRRESQYREALARLAQQKILSRSVARLKDVPVRAMEKLGWIPREKDEVRRLENIFSFFGVASIEALVARGHESRFRQSKAFKANPVAVGAWVRKGRIDALQIECAPFDERKFRSALEEARRLSSEMPGNFAERLVNLCAAAGVAVVFVPELPGTHLSGAARWLSPTKALIELSVRHKSDDHFWFTFFHEAGHILKHGRKKIFIDADEEGNSEEEDEANRFAADFLIPSNLWKTFLDREDTSRASITSFARALLIAPGIVVGRLQYERRVPFTHCNDLKKRLSFSER